MSEDDHKVCTPRLQTQGTRQLHPGLSARYLVNYLYIIYIIYMPCEEQDMSSHAQVFLSLSSYISVDII